MSIKDEVKAVKNLGEEIGYGHMMVLSSALWRKALRDKGFSEYGAFITTLPNIDYDENTEPKYNSYDDIVNKYS